MSLLDQLNLNFNQIVSTQKSSAPIELRVEEIETFRVAHQKAKLDTYSFSKSHRASIRSVVNGHEGMASTENLSLESLRDTLKKALLNAEIFAEANPPEADFDLPEHNDFTQHRWYPSSKLHEVSPTEKLEISRSLDAAVWQTDPRVKAASYSGYSESLTRKYLLNNRGLRLESDLGRCHLASYVLVEEDGQSKMAYGDPQVSYDPRRLQPETLAQESASRSLRQLGSKTLQTGRYTCVFSPEAVRSFFDPFGSKFLSAKSIFEESSPFATKLNMRVGSELLSLDNDPHLTDSPYSRNFDDEGSPTFRSTLIENGVFVRPLSNLRWAAKLKIENSASAVATDNGDLGIDFSNLVIRAGTQSPQELLASENQILFIDDLEAYHGYNSTTGSFSCPARGFWFEGGERLHPVDDFLISGDIFEIMRKIIAIGNDLNVGNNPICVPSLLVADVSVAGK
jgi:PmbA protein